jgi:hypothetical protein
VTRPVVLVADAFDVVRTLFTTAPLLAPHWGRISLTDPRDTASAPWVRLTRVGGALDVPSPVTDAAQLDVQCFAPPGPNAARVAHLLARQCRAVLLAGVGFYAHGGAITRVVENVGLSWQPDDSRSPAFPRWLFTATVTIHTSPA